MRGKFTKVDSILGQKIIPFKYRKLEIIKREFNDHNYIPLKISHKQIKEKIPKYLEIKYTLLDNLSDE